MIITIIKCESADPTEEVEGKKLQQYCKVKLTKLSHSQHLNCQCTSCGVEEFLWVKKISPSVLYYVH